MTRLDLHPSHLSPSSQQSGAVSFGGDIPWSQDLLAALVKTSGHSGSEKQGQKWPNN